MIHRTGSVIASRRALGNVRRSAPELALIAAAAAPRVWAAWNDHGVLWADEIFQSVEQAHRLVFGVGMIPWEFRDGARSWIFPGLLAGVLKVGSIVAHDGLALMRVVKLAMAFLSIAGMVWGMRIARRVQGRAAGLFAGALIGGFPALIVYAPRAMSEMASAALLTGVALLTLGVGWSSTGVAGFIGGIATFIRLQNAFTVAVLLLVPLLRKRWRDARRYVIGGIAGVAIGAAVDWASWGEPYHSIWTNVKFNLVQGNAAKMWGSSPWTYYFETFWTSTGWPLAIVAIGIVVALPRVPALAAAAAALIGAHMAIAHKEFRFVTPAVPLALVVSAIGLARIVERVPRVTYDVRLQLAIALVLGVAVSKSTPGLTQAKMGYLVHHPSGQRSVWHHDEERNLALAEVSKHDDVCGVAVPGIGAVSTGGYSYLHKRVPVAWGSLETAAANYYVWSPDPNPAPGYREVRTIKGVHTVFRRDGPCTPMPIVENM